MKKHSVIFCVYLLLIVSLSGLAQTSITHNLKDNPISKDQVAPMGKQDRINNAVQPKLSVQTTAVKYITSTNATCTYSIATEKGTVTRQGVCIGKGQNPSIANNIFSSKGLGPINFSADITGLSPNTKYYVRAFATTSSGTTYGNELSFTTLAKK